MQTQETYSQQLNQAEVSVYINYVLLKKMFISVKSQISSAHFSFKKEVRSE